MPKDTKEDLPDTMKRSPAKAQRTFAKTLESAHEEYELGGEGSPHRLRLAEAQLQEGGRPVGTQEEEEGLIA